MESDDIKTESDFWAYCVLWQHDIYVREKIDGKWDNVPLSQLTPEQQVSYIRKWMADGHIPVRVVKSEQI
jgi:hypothetical protein